MAVFPEYIVSDYHAALPAVPDFEPLDVSDAQIIATLRDVVNEQPNKVYVSPEHMRPEDIEGDPCFYVHVDEKGENPAAGCLIGEVLHRCGVPLAVLGTFEFLGAGVVLPKVISGHKPGLLLDPISDVLATVQAAQDSGKTWREALAQASDRGMI
jgi:hypothetical protein